VNLSIRALLCDICACVNAGDTAIGVNLAETLGERRGGSRRLGSGRGVGSYPQKSWIFRLKWRVMVNSDWYFFKSGGGQFAFAFPTPNSGGTCPTAPPHPPLARFTPWTLLGTEEHFQQGSRAGCSRAVACNRGESTDRWDVLLAIC